MKDNVTKFGKSSNLTKCNILKYDIELPLLQLLRESSICNVLNKTIPSSKDIEWFCLLRSHLNVFCMTCGISGFNIEKLVGQRNLVLMLIMHSSICNKYMIEMFS